MVTVTTTSPLLTSEIFQQQNPTYVGNLVVSPGAWFVEKPHLANQNISILPMVVKVFLCISSVFL